MSSLEDWAACNTCFWTWTTTAFRACPRCGTPAGKRRVHNRLMFERTMTADDWDRRRDGIVKRIRFEVIERLERENWYVDGVPIQVDEVKEDGIDLGRYLHEVHDECKDPYPFDPMADPFRRIKITAVVPVFRYEE